MLPLLPNVSLNTAYDIKNDKPNQKNWTIKNNNLKKRKIFCKNLKHFIFLHEKKYEINLKKLNGNNLQLSPVEFEELILFNNSLKGIKETIKSVKESEKNLCKKYKIKIKD